MLHDVLWRSNLPLAQSCLAHPFIQALGDGTLPADRFRAFIAQDAFFLRAFLKATPEPSPVLVNGRCPRP